MVRAKPDLPPSVQLSQFTNYQRKPGDYKRIYKKITKHSPHNPKNLTEEKLTDRSCLPLDSLVYTLKIFRSRTGVFAPLILSPLFSLVFG